MELAEKGDPLSSVLFPIFSMLQLRNFTFYWKLAKLETGKMQNWSRILEDFLMTPFVINNLEDYSIWPR